MISRAVNPNNLGSGLREAFSLSPEAALEFRDLISDFRLEYYHYRKQDYKDCFSLAC